MMTDRRTVHIPVSLSDGNRAATVSLARAPWEPQSSQVTDHCETAPTGRVIRHDRRRRICMSAGGRHEQAQPRA